MRVPVRQSAWVVALALVLVGCGSTPPASPAGSAGARGGQSSPPDAAAAPGALEKGPLDPALTAAWRPQVALDPQAIANQADALGASLRQQVDAAGTYGQDAADEQQALLQLETQALSQLRDKVLARLSGGASVETATLASYRGPTAPVAVRPAEGLLGLTWLYVVIMSMGSIDAFDPRRGDQPIESITLPLNGTAGKTTMSATATLTVGVSAGVISAKLTLEGSVSRDDASGRQLSTAGSSSFAFTINPCPDPSGGVAGAVDLTDSETTFSPGRMTLGWNITAHGDYRTQVTDQAEIGSTTTKVSLDQKLTRTIDQSHESDVALSDSTTYAGDGSVVSSQGGTTVDNLDGTITTNEAKGALGIATLFGESMPLMMAQAAKGVWQGGKCFEVRPDPKEAEVAPHSETPVKVTVYHWVDKADVQLPVKATLSGAGKIDPSGQAVTSPATFTYTAAGPGSQGQVEFKVISRRGIGSTTGTYKVKGNLTVDISGTYSENAGGVWVINLQVSGAGIELTAADDGTISATGNVTVKGTAKATIVACTATINEKISVIARGQLQGPPDAQVWHVQLGPGSVNSLGQVTKCPNITVPSNQGDYFGQWSTTLGYADLPAVGGTISLSGSTGGLAARQAKGTFVATTR